MKNNNNKQKFLQINQKSIILMIMKNNSNNYNKIKIINKLKMNKKQKKNKFQKLNRMKF